MRPFGSRWNWLVGALALLTPALALAVTFLIYRGSPTKPGSFPAVVGLTYEFERGPRCTGAMISNDMVLTAGHCLCATLKYNIRLTNVFVGDDATDRALATRGHFFPVTGWRAAYDCKTQMSTTGVDVGVVRIDRPIQGMSPLEFASNDIISRAQTMLITGFGATDVSGKHFDYRKRFAIVPVISTDCDPLDVRVEGCKPGREMVAGKLASPDTCSGDSGSPILAAPQLDANYAKEAELRIAGITSRGVATSETECGGGGIYVLLTPPVRQWITAAEAALRRQAG